jgi:hypothetical protein
LIVDDHPDFRAAGRALLEAAGFAVLGEAADGESAIAQGREPRSRVRPAHPHPAVVSVLRAGGSSHRRRLATSPALGFTEKERAVGGLAVGALSN